MQPTDLGPVLHADHALPPQLAVEPGSAGQHHQWWLGDVEFDPPEADEIPVWFDLDAHARTVRVRIRAGSLDSLPAPHRLGEATDLGDGRVELDITVSGDRRLEHLLVCLDADAEIVSPPAVRDLRREHAARLLEAFEG